jgi:CBS domain containing-hemolysin-like protein
MTEDHLAQPVAEPERATAGEEAPRQAGLIERLRSFLGLRSENVRDVLEELIENREEQESPLDENERALLKNILMLREKSAHDVMVPRAHIIAIEQSLDFEELVAHFVEAGHSRLPVYRETLDDVIGMVHVKDVLIASRGKKPALLADLLRPVLFVPPSLGAIDLLAQMRARRTHLAMVVDEYGGIDGLVTIEDVVEEIVGDIEDEHDIGVTGVKREADGSYIVDGTVTIRDLNREFDWRLPDDDVATVAGLVLHEARRIPDSGQVFSFHGFRFEVLERQRNQIRLLKITPPTNSSDPAAAASAA